MAGTLRNLALVVLLAMFTGTTSANIALQERCTIDWSGVPLDQAFSELAGTLSIPYVLDSSIPAEKRQTRIRLYGTHLTGEQALRWLARAAGLEAAVVEGTALIVSADRLPQAWLGTYGYNPRAGTSSDEAWAILREREADLNLVDAPLMLVAKEISGRYGIDVIFDPAILARQELIHFQESRLRLDRLCEILREKLDAAVGYWDGALWVRSAAQGMPTTPPPAGSGPKTASSKALGPEWGALARPIRITEAMDWSGLRELLSGVTGLPCRIEVAPGTPQPGWNAHGSVREVLEAAYLLGLIDYRLERDESGSPRTLLISPPRTSRYSAGAQPPAESKKALDGP